MNTNTIPEVITARDLIEKAGSNIADPQIVFEGEVFDGTLAFRNNPMESEAAYSAALHSVFEITQVIQEFPGLSYDEVAVAAHRTLRRMPEGKPQPVSNDPYTTPATRRIDTGYDWETGLMNTLTVPAGEMSLPFCHGKTSKWQPTLTVVQNGDGSGSMIANIIRGDQDAMQGVFKFVEDLAVAESIYLGQVVDVNYNYQKLTSFKPEDVALTDELRNAVDLFVRGPLQYTDALKREGLPPKTGLFLHGDPGGGKTMIVQLCEYIAARMGAMVIRVAPETGIAGLRKANEMSLRLMKHGHKVLQSMEDMEKLCEQSRESTLDVMDGGEAKGLNRVMLGTTNFEPRIDRAMLRPGRFDGVVECSLPDLVAFEHLGKVLLRGRDLSGIDWAEAFPHFEGYTYAFIANAVQNIIRAAVNRQKGVEGEITVTTEDLIAAALSVRGHFELFRKEQVVDEPTLDKWFNDTIHAQVESTVDDLLDGRHWSDDVDYDQVEERAREACDLVVENRLHNSVMRDRNGDTMGNIQTN